MSVGSTARFPCEEVLEVSSGDLCSCRQIWSRGHRKTNAVIGVGRSMERENDTDEAVSKAAWDCRDQYPPVAAGPGELSQASAWQTSFELVGPSVRHMDLREEPCSAVNLEPSRYRQIATVDSKTSVVDFVRRKFIPEHVARKRSAGRAHFRAILKHVLPPEQVALLFEGNPDRNKYKLKAVAGWPYIDSYALCDINQDMVARVTSAALEHGYSIQTAMHIRNVIRSIFSHAIRTSCFTGRNPASQVALPVMSRRELYTLSLTELGKVLSVMQYPEREITLFALLTEMSVSEICGLQWKYLNLSNISCSVGQELIPPKTIAVRKQIYRGEPSDVVGSRNRFVRIAGPLWSALRDLKMRPQFTAIDDFVLVSRNGTSIHPENIAARRLKLIGKSFEMPWLSWSVFHRTRTKLMSEFGRAFPEELEKLLLSQATELARPRSFRQADRNVDAGAPT